MDALEAARTDDPERLAAQLLRQAHAEKHLSQRALAAIAGVPQSTVARIEGGHVQPSLPLLYRLLGAAAPRRASRRRRRTVTQALPTADDVAAAMQEILPLDQRGPGPDRGTVRQADFES